MIGKIYLFTCVLTFLIYWIYVFKIMYLLKEKYDTTPIKEANKNSFASFECIIKTICISIIPIYNVIFSYVICSNEVVDNAIEQIVARYNLQKK